MALKVNISVLEAQKTTITLESFNEINVEVPDTCYIEGTYFWQSALAWEWNFEKFKSLVFPAKDCSKSEHAAINCRLFFPR